MNVYPAYARLFHCTSAGLVEVGKQVTYSVVQPKYPQQKAPGRRQTRRSKHRVPRGSQLGFQLRAKETHPYIYSPAVWLAQNHLRRHVRQRPSDRPLARAQLDTSCRGGISYLLSIGEYTLHPKSPIFTSPFIPSNKFSGFMSRCITFFVCK